MSSLGEVIPVIRSPQQNYILKPINDAEEIRRLYQETKDATEHWYTRKNPADAMKEIQDKEAKSRATTMEAYKSISLEERSDDEVIAVLKHRDEIMRAKSIVILESRLTNPSDAQNQADLSDKLRTQPRLIIGMFNTDDVAVLTKALAILSEIIDEKFGKILRQTGGIPVICRLLRLEQVKSEDGLLQYLFYIILSLSKEEDNRESFKSGNGIIPMVPFLSYSANARVQLMATRSLLNLSYYEPNQPIITRAGALPYCFSNISGDNYDLRIETLFLIRNLGCCEKAQQAVTVNDLDQLVSFLADDQAYTEEDNVATVEYRKSSQMQKVILHGIAEFCKLERNKQIVGQLNIMDKLRRFFMPLNPQNGLKWNYQILEKVLTVIDRLITVASNRNEFIEIRGLGLVSRIIQNYDSFPEDCVLTAAQIITTLATSDSANQQSSVQNGIDLLLGLLQQNPDKPVIQQLVSQLLKSIAVAGQNRAFAIDRDGPGVLIRLIRESSVKEILENSAIGLAAFSTEEQVQELIITEDLIPTLIGLLQLNLIELQLPVVDILSNVVKDDNGVSSLVKSGGMLPLVSLLHSKKPELLEGAIIIFAKVLFHKENGEYYRKYFFDAEGDIALLKILTESKDNRVLSPCLSVLSVMTQIRDGRAALLQSGITVKIEQLEREGKMSGDDQHANFLRIIKINLKREQEENKSRIQEEAELDRKQNLALEAERRRIEELVRTVQEQQQQASAQKTTRYWLKVEYEGILKLFPVTLELTYDEFIYNVCKHFEIESYEKSTWNDNKDIVAFDDQSDLNYVLDLLTKGGEVTIIIHAANPVKTDTSGKGAKLDELLKDLTHKQLRELIKLSIAGEDIIPPLKQYVIVNRQVAQNKKPITVPNLVAVTSAPVSNNTPIKSASTVPLSLANNLSTGQKPPPVAPPPPPPVTIKSSKSLVQRSLTESDQPATIVEELQQGGKKLRSVDPSDIPKPRLSFIDELSTAKLKHIDIADASKPAEARDLVLGDIRKKKEPVTTGSIKLLSQGLEEGRKYWIRQPERYIKNFKMHFYLTTR